MRDPFAACSGKNSRRSRRISRGGALHRKGERNSRVVAPFPESPRCLSPFQRNLFSLHCLEFHAEDRLPRRGSTPNTVARGTALWERLVGTPRGKASRERHRSLDVGEGKNDTAATALEESARASPHSRRGLTPMGRLQTYPKIHVSTAEESSGSGPDSTQGLRPRHRGEEESREAPEQLEWGLASPEATRTGPLGHRRKTRAPASTRENPGGSPLQAR